MSKQEGTFDNQKVPKPPIPQLEAVAEYLKSALATGGTSGTFDDLTRVFNTSNTTSGTFLGRLYAFRSFGFMDIDTKNKTYRFTLLGLDLVQPDSPQGEIVALQAACRNIDVLRTIWEGYQSQMLPALEFLPNALSKKFGIPAESKIVWANYFVRAGRFARFIEERQGGLYVNSGYSRDFTTRAPEADASVREMLLDENARGNIQPSSPMPRAGRAAQNATDVIEELSGLMTTGNKLHRKVGNSYILLYMDASMTKEEATEFEKVMDKLSEAAKTLLSMI